MPLIPFPKAREQAAVPNAVTGNPRAPTADMGGVSGAVSQLARAGQQSEIDPSPFMAPGRGLEKVGEAVQGVAGLMLKLKAAKDEATGDYKIGKAQEQLRRTQADWERRKVKIDPGQWEEEYAAMRRGAIDSVLADDTLDPKTRKRLELHTQDWDSGQMLTTAKDSVMETGQKASSMAYAGIDARKQANDFAGARAGVKMIEGKYWNNPVQSQNKLEEIDRAEKHATEEAQMNDVLGITRADGIKAADAYIDEHGDSEITKEKMRKASQSAYQDAVSEDAAALTNAVSLGVTDPMNPDAITVPAQVNEWQKDNPRITPRIRELARNHVIALNDATRKQNVIANAGTLASRYYAEASGFDFKRDGEDKFWQLSMRIAELPAAVRDDVNAVLEAKLPGRPGSGKAPPGIKNQVNQTLYSMFRDGQFGAFVNGTGEDKYTGEKIPQDELGKSRRELYKTNEKQKQQALASMAKVGGMMADWMDQNQDKAKDPQKVLQQMYRFLPDGTRAGLLDMFSPRAGVTEQMPIPSLPAPATAPKVETLETPGEADTPDVEDDLDDLGLPAHPGPVESILFEPR